MPSVDEVVDAANRGLLPRRARISHARFRVLERRACEWELVDADTLSLAAARDMVVEMRAANRELLAHGDAILWPVRTTVIALAAVVGVAIIAAVASGGVCR